MSPSLARPAWLFARLMAALCVMVVCWAACSGSAATGQRRVARTDAIIRIQCNVADAELWIDDRFIAPVGSLRSGIALGPGKHRVEIRHDRYHTHYDELELAAQEKRTLIVDMAEILP